jgi:hypothetical protein
MLDRDSLRGGNRGGAEFNELLEERRGLGGGGNALLGDGGAGADFHTEVTRPKRREGLFVGLVVAEKEHRGRAVPLPEHLDRAALAGLDNPQLDHHLAGADLDPGPQRRTVHDRLAGERGVLGG